jgi:sulfonate transport system permease protein
MSVAITRAFVAAILPGRDARAATRRVRITRLALGLVIPAILAIAWELVVHLGWTSGRLAPPPSVIFATFVDLARTGDLQRNTLVTLARVAAGFAIGVAAATLIGAAAGYYAPLRRLLEASKIVLIAVGVFFPIYLGLMGAIQSVDRKLVEVGRLFRLSGTELVRRILLPAVLPAYIIALRSGLGLGWMFVVAAELMGASEGLGYLLIDGQQLGKPAEIVAAIVAFAVLGKTTDWLIAITAAPFLRWQDVVRQD